MSKSRIEALSDGVFAIVMTLLVIEIHVPVLVYPTGLELWAELGHLLPLLFAYVVSFTVIAMYWTSHHALFHSFVRTSDRMLLQLNSLFLMVLALIPFTTHMMGSYPHNMTAIAIYGGHIILLGTIGFIMMQYVFHSPKIETHDVPSRTRTQARIRNFLPSLFAILGIGAGALGIDWLPQILFIAPVIFNLIPGSLDAIEKSLGISIH